MAREVKPGPKGKSANETKSSNTAKKAATATKKKKSEKKAGGGLENKTAKLFGKNSPAKFTLALATPSISGAVRKVIADYKHIDISEVTVGKKLSDPSLSFNDSDCLDLEQKINLYFFNDLGMVFDRLLDGPDDIKKEFFVSQVIARVNSVHPRRRT